MTAAPAVLDGLAPLAPACEGFVIDLWGTLHDGFRLLPGAADCLPRLREHGPVLIVSNAQRRRRREIDRLRRMGLAPDAYDDLVTAGELCRARLTDDLGPGRRRFCYVGPEDDAGLLDGRRFRRVGDLDDADLLLVCDPSPDLRGVAGHERLLAAARARDLTLVCSNPDRWSVWGGERRLKPDAIAERYAARGGRVLWYGKPGAEIFALALARAGLAGRRVLVIGDGLDAGIRGAAAAGLDACFVAGGRHATELGLDADGRPDPARLAAAFAAHGVSPLATVPAFVWRGPALSPPSSPSSRRRPPPAARR